MADYQAPLQDMHFVMNRLADLPGICTAGSNSDISPEVVDAALTEAAKLASEVLAPLNVVGDQNPAYVEDKKVIQTKGFDEAYKQFSAGGWAGMPCDVEYGGMGFPELTAGAVGEMWASSNMAFSLCPLLTMGAIGAIRAHASDALKQQFLPKMVSGEWTGTMNLTEPQAGSDLAAVRASANPEGEHYRIRGTKIFITWGDHQMTENIVHLVLARLPDAPEGVKGISLFIVPKFLVNDDGTLGERNDAYATSVEHKMGIHGSPTCVMNFGEGDGAIGYLVGEAHRGLRYMFVMMNMARLHVGIEGVAISERAYQQAVGYAKERVQGSPLTGGERVAIIEHPDIRRMLLQMRALTEAARAITYVVAAEFDKLKLGDKQAQAKIDYLTPIGKAWPTEIAQEVTYLAVQIHGGMGFVEETGVAQHMRDARITTIYEGTTGIQAMDLTGRKLASDRGKSLRLLLKGMQTELAGLAGNEQSDAIKASVLESMGLLENAAGWIGKQVIRDINVIGSAAYHFLMLNGLVFGGFYMAKAASIAVSEKDLDNAFFANKLVTAQFYAEQILPRAQAHYEALKTSPELVMKLKNEYF
jgi:alkylation response protein AidB-like acyl-CoA dehydrogenase